MSNTTPPDKTHLQHAIDEIMTLRIRSVKGEYITEADLHAIEMTIFRAMDIMEPKNPPQEVKPALPSDEEIEKEFEIRWWHAHGSWAGGNFDQVKAWSTSLAKWMRNHVKSLSEKEEKK